jgi:hypothetical protein
LHGRHPCDGSNRPEGEHMLAVQARLPLILPMQARARRVRRPFTPSQGGGSYRLPREVQDRLTAALAPYRNRDAAFALATFIARFWSVPGRVVGTFPIDRRELADRQDLGLTEAQVRGAIRVLEEVGFLERAIPPSGSRYKATEDGLRRKPILFAFGFEYAPAFIRANNRAAAAQSARSGERRPLTPTRTPRPSVALPAARRTNSPKSKSEADKTVLMGELRQESGLPPKASEPNPQLEAALDRLLQGIRQRRGG